jgi:hypothetical protein
MPLLDMPPPLLQSQLHQPQLGGRVPSWQMSRRGSTVLPGFFFAIVLMHPLNGCAIRI